MKKAIMKIMKGDEVVEEIVGGFVRADGDKVVMQLAEGGEAHFPKDDEHWLEMSDELFVMPTRAKVKVEPSDKAPVVKASKAPTSGGPLKVGSPLEVVVGICKANPSMTRKELIAEIMKAMPGKTEGFASTYHQLAKKHL